jgi:hypothetical protein
MILKLLDTLLVIFIVLTVIRFFARYILPSLLGNYVRRKMSEMGQQFNQQPPQSREGEVTIEGTPAGKKKKYPKDSGEYTDYEEIK